jgi:hypothetical protein
MDTSFIESGKDFLKQRRIILALIALFAVSIIFIGYVGFSVHQTDLKVVTHYTAFGATNFYRDQWYYLITFVLFGIIIAVGHSLIALKIFAIKGLELSLAFIWMSVIMVGIAAVIIHQVLKVAALT